MECLATLELLPLRDTLQRVFTAHRVLDASAFDVSRLLLELLTKSELFEDFVIASGTAVTFLDAKALASTCNCHPKLNDATANAWLLCAASSLSAGADGPKGFFSLRMSEQRTLDGHYYFSELLFDDDTQIMDARGVYSLPLFSGLEDFVSTADPVAVAKDAARSGQGLELAISGAASQYLGKSTIDSEYSLHAQFLADVQQPDVLNNDGLLKRMLRASAEVVTGTSPAKTHALRSGAGPEDAQRADGDWKAWRHDIDDDYHLHYWRGTGGVVELATVRSHNYFDIPARSPLQL